MYKAFLALHVLAAVLAIGPLVHLVTTAARGLRNNDAGATESAARGTTIYTFVSTIVVIFGFGVMSAPSPRAEGSAARFTHTFIWLSLALWFVAVVIALAITVPSLEKATTKIRSGESVAALTKRVSATGGIIAVIYVIIILLMVYRPGG